MADTIREFLVGLGWQLDESGERRFIAAIEGATLRANLLADAIENMARVVVDKVAVVAENFEQLYYQSQRIGASANSISAFEDSVKRLGGTAEGARSSLQGFGDFLNNHIGAAGALAKQLGIPLKDTADRGLFLLEVGEKLAQMPKYLATQYRETFHLGDYDTIAAAGRSGGRGFYDDSLKRQREAGLNPEVFKQATEFENKWRDVWDRIGTMAEGGESKLLTALTEPMQKFGKWLDENSPKINEAITNMATAVGSLTIAWVDDLNKVHWNDVATDFEHVSKSIAGFVSELTGLMRWLVDFNERSKDWWITKFFNGLTGGGLGSIHGSPEFEGGGDAAPFTEGGGGGGGLWGRVKRFFGAGGAPAGLRARAVGGAPTGNEAALAKQAYDYWRGQGLSHDQALSVIGNQRGEQALGGLVHGDGGSASGQFQWHADRVADILRNTGIDVRTAGFLDQQKAARWELEHGAGGGHIWNALKNAKSREEAIWLLVHNFERSGNQRGDAAIRLGHTARYGRIIPPDSAKTPTGSVPAGWSDPAHHSRGLSDPINPGFIRAWEEGKFREGIFAPQAWDHGHQWDKLNASLPVGSATTNDNSKSVTSSVTNNVTVNAPDPHSAAAMVGLHLDRSANDLARNLQGAHQ